MNFHQTESPILEHNRICHIIDRMAWQIYEHHYIITDLYMVGITPRGSILCQLLANRLKEISAIKIHIFSLTLDKELPHTLPAKITPDLPGLDGRNILIVDDVLNTGSTLLYALKPFLRYRPASLTTAVLVDRNHKRFPVYCDVVGIQLSTSLQEHVFVDLSSDRYKVYLR
ncbi:MAG: phosphoribosyltransferase family protein [Thermaurantimonas sp.]|uniref:phosphoribosyltransferase family protein n=1 Tax=Thermaurantimonas sp. TaxID=2681568 RepID=UPI00391A5E3D